MDKIPEFLRILYKEYRGIIAYQVPVTVFGIEFYRKTPGVALCIGRSSLTTHGGKAGKYTGFLTYFGKDLGPGVL